MKEKFLLFIIMFLLIGSLNSIYITKANDNNKVVEKTNETDFEITNINDLDYNLMEDVVVEDYSEYSKEIITESDDFIGKISKVENEITFIDDENNEIKVSVDDSGLEYDSNDEGTITFVNEESGYSVQNQILDGGFRQLFIIESEDSPKEFKIDVELDEGHKIIEQDGLYFVADNEGEIVYLIGAPWAVDSEGNFINSYYEVRENTIYQIVKYEGNKYPITADPLFCKNNDTIDNTNTKWNKNYKPKDYKEKGTLAVKVRTCAKVYITANWTLTLGALGLFNNSYAAKMMWDEVKADADYKKHVKSNQHTSMRNQFICHAVNPGTIWKDSWNLEPYRKQVSLASTYKALCNP